MTNANTIDTDQGAFGRDARRFLRSNAPAVSRQQVQDADIPKHLADPHEQSIGRQIPASAVEHRQTTYKQKLAKASKFSTKKAEHAPETVAAIKHMNNDADPGLISRDEADAGATDLRHPSGPAGPSQHVRGKQVVVQHDAGSPDPITAEEKAKYPKSVITTARKTGRAPWSIHPSMKQPKAGQGR